MLPYMCSCLKNTWWGIGLVGGRTCGATARSGYWQGPTILHIIHKSPAICKHAISFVPVHLQMSWRMSLGQPCELVEFLGLTHGLQSPCALALLCLLLPDRFALLCAWFSCDRPTLQRDQAACRAALGGVQIEQWLPGTTPACSLPVGTYQASPSQQLGMQPTQDQTSVNWSFAKDYHCLKPHSQSWMHTHKWRWKPCMGARPCGCSRTPRTATYGHASVAMQS